MRRTDVKICGLSTPATVDAAVQAGARYVGFVFYPPSPRAVSVELAGQLARRLPTGVRSVGLFVEPSDDELDDTLSKVPLDLIQLHGGELPARVAEVKRSVSVPVMKAIRVATSEDVAEAEAYQAAADRLLFDAKPPKTVASLPGGNGLVFDWSLLAGRRWSVPWMLSGGLTVDTVAAAVARTGAPAVDVSSGVEDRPGTKSVAKIHAFIAAAQARPQAA